MSSGAARIAVVCSTLNQLGGPALHIRNLYTRLNGGEFSFKLVLCSAVEEELRDYMLSGGVAADDLIFIPHSRKRVLVPFVLLLRDLFRRERFGLIHAFETQTQVLAGLAARWAGADKFICQCEAQFLPSTISFPKRALFRSLNSSLKDYFSLSITVSNELAQELKAGGLRPADKIEVVHPGISLPSGQRSREARRGSLAMAAPVFGAASRLSVEKGLDRFIEAAALVARELPSARFVICGDGIEKPALQELARKLRMDTQVEFRPWTGNVAEALGTYDIFVMPSLREGLPITLLEAMAAGLPVVASDIGGIREVVTDGKEGLLVNTADKKAFSAALISLGRDPDRAVNMGGQGAARVRSCFTVEREMQRMGDIYRQVLGARQG